MAYDITTQMASSGKSFGDTLHLVGFTVAAEQYGIDILKVQEIIRMVEITPMPNSADHVKGVINLRGKIIPVIDFRSKMNLYGNDDIPEKERRIIVASLERTTVGITVDKVSQVIKIPADQISPTPEVARGGASESIMGVGRIANDLMVLLDLEKMFNQENFGDMTAAM